MCCIIYTFFPSRLVAVILKVLHSPLSDSATWKKYETSGASCVATASRELTGKKECLSSLVLLTHFNLLALVVPGLQRA